MRPAARTDRDSTDKMNAIYVRFQWRQFWRGGTADFKNDGNMYRILRGGRGAATAKLLEYNGQNGGKSKIEAKKMFFAVFT